MFVVGLLRILAGLIAVFWMAIAGFGGCWLYDRLTTTPAITLNLVLFHPKIALPAILEPAYVKGLDAGAAAARQRGARQVAAVAVVDHRADQAEVTAQGRIRWRTKTLTLEIPTYVASDPSPPRGCITWGLVRLHDAAVRHLDPGELKPPAGQPDDACSDIDPAAFARRLVANYGAADANAEQLDALQADITDRLTAAKGATGSKP